MMFALIYRRNLQLPLTALRRVRALPWVMLQPSLLRSCLSPAGKSSSEKKDALLRAHPAAPRRGNTPPQWQEWRIIPQTRNNSE